jgi:uncharacterized protein YgbK (DUF1537 family)
MHVAIVADDLTGAADTGVQLARAGYRTAVAFRGSSMPPAGVLVETIQNKAQELIGLHRSQIS